MNHVELHPDSVLTVNGVLYSGWIPPLKAYGPLRKCSIKVSDIINLLNNDIYVDLRDDQNENLYFFIKQHNELIKLKNTGGSIAQRAEAVLYERVYKKALEQDKAEDKENPFIADEDEDLDVFAETLSLQSKGTAAGMNDPLKGIRKNKKVVIKRPHAYDIFKNTKNNSLTSQLDDANELLEYGSIDFNVE